MLQRVWICSHGNTKRAQRSRDYESTATSHSQNDDGSDPPQVLIQNGVLHKQRDLYCRSGDCNKQIALASLLL